MYTTQQLNTVTARCHTCEEAVYDLALCYSKSPTPSVAFEDVSGEIDLAGRLRMANWRLGFFRLWVLLTIVWVILVGALTT